MIMLCTATTIFISLSATDDFHRMVVSSIIGIIAIDKSDAILKLTFPPITIDILNITILINSR